MSEEHPRNENDPRDEIELFLRDAYAAGCNAAQTKSLFVAFQYAAREAPKLRAIIAAQCNEEWQPIDTAPADGETSVLLWFPSPGICAFGITYRYHDGTVSASSPMVLGEEPTHWMPMPEPPR